ncbi:murein transglycosylase A [Alteraurantiacibacter palmitatis]|uniref:peptidoglycan lytic exotransglycosylase n=1 Tax=Alteraurantiacibacter palmitatis TaxID=2054628 RepID=A0ABV7EB95_9SPHN
MAVLALLAGCVSVGPSPAPPPSAPPAATAALLGVARGPAIASLGLQPRDSAGALDAFHLSCPVLLRRADDSGLTRPEDWREACTAAATWPRADAARFFEVHFESVVVGDGAAFATGYFEPEIAGSRTRRPGFEVPVYGLPPDLIRCWRDDTPQSERTGRAPLGRLDERGICVPYYTHAEIADGALAGRGLEIGWAADPVEFFFLQIQGSGRLLTPEGEVIRIGYAGQNGHSYTGIGALMRERGLLGSGPGQYAGSMQGIMQYIRENPQQGRALMRENESFVFFRVLEGDGPLGSIGVPVRAESSVAVDPRFVPYGAPVFLSTDRPEARGLWVAQDTGGAIRGANRFDTFWGAGERARDVAGGMSARGQATLLLPRGTLARLGVR